MGANSNHTKDELIRTARGLYADGASMEEIGEAVGRSRKTIYRWKNGDDVDWDAIRNETRRLDPRALMAKCWRILQRKIDQEDADGAAKIQKVMEKIRDQIGDPATQQAVMAEIAKWAHENLSQERRDMLADVFDAYMDYVRSESR